MNTLMNKPYAYWLYNIQGLGNQKCKKLVSFFGSAKAVYEAKDTMLASCPFLSDNNRKAMCQAKDTWNLQEEYRYLKDRKISFVTIEDEEYPQKLQWIYDRPFGLYYRGNLPQKEEKCAAIVGARMCSAYGKHMTEAIVNLLAEEEYTVVSGMAKGIDGIAHKKCIEKGKKTIAVLGSGIDICYPPEHRLLYEKITENGCLLSEYPPGVQPQAFHFPARNRLISGLSDFTVVIEAREKSGSLITADMALEQGRDVYAVPGRATDPMSAGCNRLISQGAGILYSPEAFLKEIKAWGDVKKGENFSNVKTIEKLDENEQKLFLVLDFYEKGVERLMEETGLDLLTTLHGIVHLCEIGLVQETFKNYYIRL